MGGQVVEGADSTVSREAFHVGILLVIFEIIVG